MLSQVPTEDACLSCGACCAFFRVSFYWAEGMEPIKPVHAVSHCKAPLVSTSVVGCMNSVALHVKKFKSLMINATKHDVHTI